jgi:RNA polymerase sigma-70 factor (ECF subfamily)
MDAAGGRQAWIERAVAQFEGPLCRYALRLLGEMEPARDAVQETFLRLLRENPEELDSRLGPWLFAVCRSRALDAKRKERRMTTRTHEDASATTDPARAVEQAESRSAALAALARLPANQQEVIRLKFQEGMSYREISRVTQLSESNVGYLIHVGLRALRATLAC